MPEEANLWTEICVQVGLCWETEGLVFAQRHTSSSGELLQATLSGRAFGFCCLSVSVGELSHWTQSKDLEMTPLGL